MKMPKRRTIYIAAGALLFLIVVYFGFIRSDAVTVETGSVSRGEMMSTIDAEGRVRYHERFVVTAPISGKMYRIQLHEGDRVPKGYVLTRIDPSPPRPTDPTRSPEPNVYAYAYNVYVPENGILTKIFVQSEGMVQAGAQLAEVSKPSQLEVVADILSTDAAKARPHMRVLVENWGGNGTLEARIRTIEPQAFTKVSSLGVEEQRVNVIADFDVPPNNIGDNYKADIRIVLWEGKDVLRVPMSALFKTGDDWQVFVVSGSKARTRTVQIGQRSTLYAEVLGGLDDGDTVVLYPPKDLTDRSRVKSN